MSRESVSSGLMRPALPRFATLVLALSLAACASTPPPASPPASGQTAPTPAERAPAPAERSAVLLAVNDVYRIEGAEDGRVGGLARLAALRRQLEARHPDLLVLHGGDLLFPSFLSRTYDGQQMIDVLNVLDGDQYAFDERLFIVFGNHEFDKDQWASAGLVDRRVEESQFTWLGTNIVFKASSGGPVIAEQNLRQSEIVESGGIKIGLFGVTTDLKKPAYVHEFLPPLATARRASAELRARGAEVVVGLTHLTWQQDEELLRQLGAEGPDLIIGGHEHQHMVREVDGRLILKADADARTATVVTITLGPDGRPRIAHELRELGPAAPADEPVRLRAQEWLTRHELSFCPQADPGCLGRPIGRSQTPLIGEESAIRSEETSLGNWVTDLMVDTFHHCGAQAAIINSGTLRLNQDLPPGPVTRRNLEELFGFPTPLRLLRVDGATLQKVVDHAVENWPGIGHWLQVSGLAFVHDRERGTASRLSLLTPQGPRPVRPDEEILLVVNDFLVDPKSGQDGYTMLKPEQAVECTIEQADLKKLAENALRVREPQGISPQREGRICQAPAGEGCLAAPAPGS